MSRHRSNPRTYTDELGPVSTSEREHEIARVRQIAEQMLKERFGLSFDVLKVQVGRNKPTCLVEVHLPELQLIGRYFPFSAPPHLKIVGEDDAAHFPLSSIPFDLLKISGREQLEKLCMALRLLGVKTAVTRPA